MPAMLESALRPRSIAIVGASENPHKVGGRPLLYLRRYGYRGTIYPVNPARREVQGVRAYAGIAELPEPPELAVVAVAGDDAVQAVEACAARGVKVAVVMTSGFGETGEAGLARQNRMLAAARGAGMRLIGPNCQGLANFATGAVANFSTIFHELEGCDGPVAIVSQSGANSQAIYQLVRDKGLGVRHVHATGNEADVTVAELAAAVVADPGVRLLLLYMESIKHPAALAAAAEAARSRDLPIVALKAGRTASGQRAASSHTGALATEDGVVDAFFERHAIWRAGDPHELVAAAELYARGHRPRRCRLVFISNSGASCVMAADHAERRALPLARVPAARLREVLPAFAAVDNPIDVTGALLGNPKLFADVLPIVGEESDGDLVAVALPVAGTGYDVPAFARDLAAFERRYGKSAAVAAPQPSVREPFARAGIATFARERDALDALAQAADHAALLRRPPAPPPRAFPAARYQALDEAASLAVLAQAGIAVVEHRLCRHEDEAVAAWRALDGRAVMKGCSRDVPHKSEAGLVCLDVQDAAAAFRRLRERIAGLGARFDGVIVARKAPRARELALGARLDPRFGPVVMVGDGGVYLEALRDFRLLLPPFTEEAVAAKLGELRVAPLFAGVRGEPPCDVAAFARMAVALGEAMLRWEGRVGAVDVNPVAVFETGAWALDALVESIIFADEGPR
ncbi:MAG TPA: acetate--CoA ligase family protein [Burkholderiales bacterium]